MENNNKKVVLIGGSNGIGLAIGKKLLDCGYTLEICDCLPPEEGVLDMEKVKYHHSDLLDFDEELYTNLAHDKDVEILMITAGIGYYHFENNVPVYKGLIIENSYHMRWFGR